MAPKIPSPPKTIAHFLEDITPKAISPVPTYPFVTAVTLKDHLDGFGNVICMPKSFIFSFIVSRTLIIFLNIFLSPLYSN
ncbi:hypothetical protein [Metaclostridioides mangenotii]|uniref:hypothetical protein n=1 Tax=Metaclostridioides mangenotii TaxID=1540 RepID=UPI001A9A3C81|nr:hypothetical protein [Clostridioides mangenotii]